MSRPATYCPHDDDPQSCVPCGHANGTITRPPADRRAVTVARWGGLCHACDDTFTAGDRIVRDPATRTWLHDTCWEGP